VTSPSDQYIAFVDTETGECGERRLNHSHGEAEKFYRDLQLRGVSVRVGTEATGYSRWFERLLAELGMEVWIGVLSCTSNESLSRAEIWQSLDPRSIPSQAAFARRKQQTNPKVSRIEQIFILCPFYIAAFRGSKDESISFL